MNRKRLAVLIGLIILVFAAAVMLWPDNGAEPHSEEETEESDLPEGLVLLGEEQIRSSEIMVETVGEGSAVELVFPATIAASPTGSARIDARAAGVVRSVQKTLGDYVRQGETIARIESAEAAALASQLSAARARVLQRCGWEVCTTADAIEAAVLGVEQAGAWEKAALVALLHAGAHEVRPCRLATAPSPCYPPHLATLTSPHMLTRPSTSSRPPSPHSTAAAPHAPPHSSPSVPPSCA